MVGKTIQKRAVFHKPGCTCAKPDSWSRGYEPNRLNGESPCNGMQSSNPKKITFGDERYIGTLNSFGEPRSSWKVARKSTVKLLLHSSRICTTTAFILCKRTLCQKSWKGANRKLDTKFS